MEYGVGSLVTPSHMAIDLGLLEDNMSQYKQDRWFINNDSDKSIGKQCAGKRMLPVTPAKFNEMMDQKVYKDSVSLPKVEFTVEADRDLIKGLYDTTFYGVIGSATDIDWHGLGWEYELHEIMPVIMSAAATLKKLDLESNKFRGPYFLLCCVDQFYTKQEANRGTFLTRFLGAQARSRLSSGG